MGRGLRISWVGESTTIHKKTLINAMTLRDPTVQKEKGLSSSGPSGQMPPETRQIARALAELSATRKTILMYPPGHAQIEKSIDRTRTTWDEILSSRPEVTIGTDKDGLLVGRDSSKLKDSISKEFSSILREHDLAVVHFWRGLTSEELAVFLGVIAEDPEKVCSEGGVGKALANQDVRHIQVQCVDYSKFLHTDEEEIQRRPRGKEDEDEDSLWGGFVTHLILGTLTDSEKGIPLRSADDYAPRVIASYLNNNRIDPQMALEGYEQTVQNHLNQDPPSEGGMSYRVANLRNLSALLEELQPGIRKQFLDATYQQCTTQADSPLVEDLLSGMSHGLVLEMLRQANKQGNEISPTLLNLVRKIARVKEETGGGRETDPRANRAVATNPSQHKEILDLFDREAYETFVTSDYGETLKDLSQDITLSSSRSRPSKELQEEIDSLESKQIEAQIARALLAFMQGDANVDEYEDYADKAFRIANNLIGEGQFSVPLDILNTLKRHIQDKADPDIRSVAEDYLQRFRLPTFLSKALAAFDKWRDVQDGMSKAFLTAIGPDIVPQVLNLYIQRDQSETDHQLFNLLAIFSDRVAEIAKTELRTRRGPALVSLIRLLRRLGSQDLVPVLKPLLNQDDNQIQLEVLETLVRFQDPESADLLRKFLMLKNAEVQLRAIEIAGMHKVTGLAEDLASMVKRYSWFRLDYQKNEKIIEALGRIGHPCAIPVLERLAKTRFSLYPKHLSNLKLLLFQSLRLYEEAPVAPLLRIGAQSNDERIRNACRQRSQGPGAGPIDPPPTTEEVQDSDGSPSD